MAANNSKQPCSIEVTTYPKKSRRAPILLIIGYVIAILIIIALIVVCVNLVAMRLLAPYCESGLGSRGRDMERPSIFNDLTPSEMRAVRDFLLKDTKLGLVPIVEARTNDSYIFMIDLQVPLKEAVLGFVDDGRRKPRRSAIAVLFRGDLQRPRVEEYIVGPLPVPTYQRKVTNPAYRRTPVPFTSRPVDTVERRQLHAFLKDVTRELQQLLAESYQMSHHDCDKGPDCMLFIDLPPRGHKSGDRVSWLWGYRQVEGAPLHPLGFGVQINHVSPFAEDWKVTRIVYNGQMFYEVEDLMERYLEDSLRKLRLPMDDYDRAFSSYERRGPSRFNTPGRGPTPLQPDGRRFLVEGQFVAYFGWSFNFRSRCATGLQLLDVNFQDGRIAYEIGLQELLVQYSGHSPEMSSLTFYGSSYLIGASSHELVPGVDCPATAHFVDSFHFVNTDSPRRYKHSICVFEHNGDIPLRRHYTVTPPMDGDEFRYYGGVAAASLVVRTIAVIWNKDYVFDYVFHLDGTLEIRVSTTGYLQTSFSLPREQSFGHQIHAHVIANAYQEVFHYKLDLDVSGKINRYETLQLHAENVADFWFPDQNSTRMRFRSTVVKTEREAMWKHETSPLLHHVIYNHKMFNKYGAHRGYRLIHQSPTDLVLKEASVTHAASWAERPLVVTKYKDIEDASSSIYAGGDPWDPVLDFAKYLDDNNTIVDEDLIAWATLGGTVVPSAEDVPSPTTSTHAYRLLLAPYNYFDSGPTTVMTDTVHITRQGKDGAGDVVVNTFGTTREQPRCVQEEAGLAQFSGQVEKLES